MSDREHPGPRGEVIIFRLFVALALATAVSLLYFAQLVPPENRRRIYIALAGNLALPVVGWFVLKAIERSRVRKAAKP